MSIIVYNIHFLSQFFIMSQFSHAMPTTLPAQILTEKYKDSGFFWQGKVLVADLPRLADELSGGDGDDALVVSCHLATVGGITRLSFEVVGELWVACHRCLEGLPVAVSGVYGMALLDNADSATLAKLDEGEDFVLFSELGDPRHLPLMDLLEDELLLALPSVATHADCHIPDEFLPDEGDDEAEAKENPFAMLAQLKGKLN